MTPSKEDYLKTIIQLYGDSNVVSNKQLAEAMQVSAASVTDMNNRLTREGYLTYRPYKGVQLTQKGIETATNLIRKHRLWEVFLKEKLGYSWDEVHDDAELLEHHTSDLLLERLDKYLGYPTHDPHGGLIPKEDGLREKVQTTTLTKVVPGNFFIVTEVKDDKELLEYLTVKKVNLKETYKVTGIEPYEQSILLENKEKEQINVAYKAAKNIFVDVIADK